MLGRGSAWSAGRSGVLAIGAGGYCAGLMIVAANRGVEGALAGLVAGIVSIPVIGDRLLGRRTDIFAPDTFTSLTYLVHFVGPGLLSTSLGIYPILFEGVLMQRAFVYIGAGLIAFYAGYYRGIGRRRESEASKRDKYRLEPRRLIGVALWYMGVSALSAYALMVGAFAGLENYVLLISGFGMEGYAFRGLGYLRGLALLSVVSFHLSCLAMWWSARLSLLKILITVASGVSALGITILLGNRVFVLWMIGVPMIMFHYAHRRIGAWSLPVIVGLGFAVSLLYVVTLRNPEFVLERRAHVPGGVAEVLNFYVEQTAEPHVLAEVVEHVPETLRYQYGSTVLAVLTQPLPRAVFPWKYPDAGEIYTETLHPGIWEAGVTFLGVPWLAELYMNFGGIGVVGGMLLLGMLMRRVYEWARARKSPVRAYIYAMCVFGLYFLTIRSSMQAFSGLLVWGGPAAIGIVGAIRRR